VPLDEIPPAGHVRLEPWSAVTGKLVRTNGAPVVNERLAATVPYVASGDPFVNFQEQTRTDVQGRFTIGRVPPGEWQLVRLVPMGTSGWSHQFQRPFVASPGKTNDLGNVIIDQPPPPTLIQEMKRKLGI
jgi:hypothetical protein